MRAASSRIVLTLDACKPRFFTRSTFVLEIPIERYERVQFCPGLIRRNVTYAFDRTTKLLAPAAPLFLAAVR